MENDFKVLEYASSNVILQKRLFSFFCSLLWPIMSVFPPPYSRLIFSEKEKKIGPSNIAERIRFSTIFPEKRRKILPMLAGIRANFSFLLRHLYL